MRGTWRWDFVELAESAVTEKGQHAVWFERQPRVL